MEHKGLIPNESYEIFIIGDKITNYLHFPHILDHTRGNMYCYDSYFPYSTFYSLGRRRKNTSVIRMRSIYISSLK